MHAEGKSRRFGLSAALSAAPADAAAPLRSARPFSCSHVKPRNTSTHQQWCLQRALTAALYGFRVACLVYLAAAAASRATEREV